jgi:hypothetical protein
MPGRIASIAQNPIANAAEVRTNSRRLMLNLCRQRSTSASCRAMIALCSRDGGDGKYSSLEHGRTSTATSSAIVSHASRPREVRNGSQWAQLLIPSSPDLVHGVRRIAQVGASAQRPHPPTSKAPRMNGWMRQKYVTTSPGL